MFTWAHPSAFTTLTPSPRPILDRSSADPRHPAPPTGSGPLPAPCRRTARGASTGCPMAALRRFELAGRADVGRPATTPTGAPRIGRGSAEGPRLRCAHVHRAARAPPAHRRPTPGVVVMPRTPFRPLAWTALALGTLAITAACSGDPLASTTPLPSAPSGAVAASGMYTTQLRAFPGTTPYAWGNLQLTVGDATADRCGIIFQNQPGE